MVIRIRVASALALAALAVAPPLIAQSEEFGKWESLFNGKDASGWVIAKGANIGKSPDAWSVKDGALTNGGPGVYDIATAKEFDNYEIEIEYMVKAGGNSGVYCRGQVEVQILDSFGKEKLGQGDAGGIYSFAAPLANPQKKPGEWNQFRIRHIGNRVTVWHNDVLVQDNVYVDRATGGAMSVSAATGKPLALDRGPIMLQGDHSEVHYRNIRIRPLCSGEGWRPIWNGKDLSAFAIGKAAIKDEWKIDDHAVANLKMRHDMWTKESFGNFLVHYEYRSQGNAGFYLRDQWEIQIDWTGDPKEKHSDGALYSIYPPAQLSRNGREQWNHMDVKVDGVKIWVWQNGKLIHDGVVCERRTDSNQPTPKFSKAPFKFQGDHGPVWFTNIYIKPLPDTP